MDEYLASIILFAGNFCPQGYMYCDGSILQIKQYTALFSLLGIRYGGDGQNTFALPNLNDTDKDSKKPKYIICVEGMYPQRT